MLAHQEIRYKKAGRVLKELREAARLTQSDIAKALGYSTPQFISNWERGVSLPPSLDARKLAAALKTTPRRILQLIFRAQEAELQHRHDEALRKYA